MTQRALLEPLKLETLRLASVHRKAVRHLEQQLTAAHSQLQAQQVSACANTYDVHVHVDPYLCVHCCICMYCTFM